MIIPKLKGEEGVVSSEIIIIGLTGSRFSQKSSLDGEGNDCL